MTESPLTSDPVTELCAELKAAGARVRFWACHAVGCEKGMVEWRGEVAHCLNCGRCSRPERVRLSRAAGWKKPENTVVVARPARWGNPRKVGMYAGYTAAHAVEDYRRWVRQQMEVLSFNNAYGLPPSREEIVAELQGRNLACWCALDCHCHAEVLLELANAPFYGVRRLREAFAGVRLNFNDEAGMQRAVGNVIEERARLGCVAEYRIPDSGKRRGARLDFWLPESGIAVETKVEGSTGEVVRQLKRYADLPEVLCVVLIDRRARELPPMLSGKPVVALPLWKGQML